MPGRRILSLLLLTTFPLWILLVRKKLKALGDVIRVLFGLRTWVGYLDPPGSDLTDLPALKKGILPPLPADSTGDVTGERVKEINVVYAKDYRVFNDMLIITRNFREI